MGDYFDDKEAQEKDQKVEEYDMELIDPSSKVQMAPIEIVRSEMSKQLQVFDIKIKAMREKVGRTYIDLLGDPRNFDAFGKLDELEKELNESYIKRAPISSRLWGLAETTRLFANQMMELRREYHNLALKIIELLKQSVMSYDKDIPEWKEKVDRLEQQVQLLSNKDKVDTFVDEAIIKQFMDRYGNKYIEQYQEVRDDLVKSNRVKYNFLDMAIRFFTTVHPYPKAIGQNLWQKYTAVGIQAQPLIREDSGEIPKYPQPIIRPLTKREKYTALPGGIDDTYFASIPDGRKAELKEMFDKIQTRSEYVKLLNPVIRGSLTDQLEIDYMKYLNRQAARYTGMNPAKMGQINKPESEPEQKEQSEGEHVD